MSALATSGQLPTVGRAAALSLKQPDHSAEVPPNHGLSWAELKAGVAEI